MIGDLKHRVTLQEADLTPDAGGGFTKSWQDVAEIYAAIVPFSGVKTLKFHQLESAVTHRITIRHRDDVTPAMRIAKDNENYNILTVIDREGRGEYLDLLAVKSIPA